VDVYDVDPVGLLAREVLREQLPALVAEACAWSVGLSDRPHLVRRHGRLVGTGVTLGVRAAGDLPLGAEEDERLELGGARAGSFQDALNALTPAGTVYADSLDEQVLTPFVRDVCVQAAVRARRDLPEAWAELLDDLGEDGSDPEEVVRAAEWEAPLRTEAELLLLAALADVPLVEVEAEGLPLSLVRAAEAETRAAAPAVAAPEPDAAADDLVGALYLAELALREARLPLPVPAAAAASLVAVLRAEGLEGDEVLRVLPHLPVSADAAEQVRAALSDETR
jgi:hypothetical protein